MVRRLIEEVRGAGKEGQDVERGPGERGLDAPGPEVADVFIVRRGGGGHQDQAVLPVIGEVRDVGAEFSADPVAEARFVMVHGLRVQPLPPRVASPEKAGVRRDVDAGVADPLRIGGMEFRRPVADDEARLGAPFGIEVAVREITDAGRGDRIPAALLPEEVAQGRVGREDAERLPGKRAVRPGRIPVDHDLAADEIQIDAAEDLAVFPGGDGLLQPGAVIVPVRPGVVEETRRIALVLPVARAPVPVELQRSPRRCVLVGDGEHRHLVV